MYDRHKRASPHYFHSRKTALTADQGESNVEIWHACL